MKRIIFILTMLLCVVSFGQEFRGALTGQVTDPTGAVIPNAAITVTNEGTGSCSKTTSGGDGLYTVPFLVPGKYRVNVSLKGFTSYLHTGIEILTQQTITE